MSESDQSGLNLMDRRSGRFTRVRSDPADPNSLLGTNVDAIAQTDDGGLWIGTNRGITRIDLSAGSTDIGSATFARYDQTDIRSDVPGTSIGIPTLYVDDGGSLWIGTTGPGGLDRLDPKTGRFTHYLDSPVILAIYQDRNGRMWAGGFGGFYQVDAERGTLRHYTRKDGLPSNNVVGIIEDTAGHLWLGTFNGLVRFDPSAGSGQAQAFRRYGPAYGLQDTQFHQGGILASDGSMFFGGPNGISVFDPSTLVDDPYEPPVALTGFSLFNEPASVGSDGLLEVDISVADAITLAHDQNDFTFHFAALSFNRPKESTYAYRLEPYETDWVQAGTARSSRYTNLSPGRYTFRVKAANADGLWNEQGRSIDVIIRPPWWRTIWAYTVYGLFVLGALFAVDRIQRRRLIARERERTRERELEQAREIERAYHELRETKDRLVQQEKMASLGQLTAGIAHEIKNPLNFVNNFAELMGELVSELEEEIDSNDGDSSAEKPHQLSEILADLKSNAEQIAKHGKRADGIVSAMMQHASGGTGKREPMDVNALLEEYVNLAYHGRQARKEGFTCEIERDYDKAIGRVEMVPEEMGRVFLNLLSNAFDAVSEQDHPLVHIQTKTNNDAIEIRVTDNGPGIQKDIQEKIFEPFFTTKPTGEGSTGLGLSLSYDTVTQGHGGTLTVESEEGKGATFIITLPC